MRRGGRGDEDDEEEGAGFSSGNRMKLSKKAEYASFGGRNDDDDVTFGGDTSALRNRARREDGEDDMVDFTRGNRMKLSKKAEFADFGGDRGDREVVHDGRAVRNARAAADAKNVGPKTFTRKDSKFKMDANPLPRKPPPVAESVAPKTFTRKDSKFSMDANPLSQAAMSKGGGSGGGRSAAAAG